MSFYTELVPYIDYVHSIRRLESYLSFDMKFPAKWSLPKSIVEEGQVVGFETDNQNLKGISFVSPITEKDVSVILVKIGKVIKLNKEKELKEKLFKQTVEQLKQTFEKTDIDKLQGLYFDFESEDVSPELEINDDIEEDEIEDEQDGHEPAVTEHVKE
jgi:hypothetical protein